MRNAQICSACGKWPCWHTHLDKLPAHMPQPFPAPDSGLPAAVEHSTHA